MSYDPTDPAYIYFMEHHNNHDMPFVVPVPEPSSAVIFGTIVVAFLAMRYLRRKML